MLKFKNWIFCIIFFCVFHSSWALTILHVSLNTDNNPGGNGQSGDLRFALNSMNQSLNTTPDDYAIVFDSPMLIQLNGILPIINNSSNAVNITMGNPGPTPTVTIDGNSGAYSGFFIPMGNVTIQNMIFQNLAARGGNGGNGISGGGGGMGAGGGIYAPQSFLNGSNPSITLMNVLINNCAAIGGNGGNYLLPSSPTGNEGGGGGGGFSGNGGSIITVGSTGGGGGGGFGGDGGNVTFSTDDSSGNGGGGGGGGGIGSRATLGLLTNLGNGGLDQNQSSTSNEAVGQNGNGFGLDITAGSGAGGYSGGSQAGGGGGGGPTSAFAVFGGGGGGSSGTNGLQSQGSIPPLKRNAKLILQGGGVVPSGGSGGDGAGGGGGGVVSIGIFPVADGQAATAGYGGGGGGGAGTGAYDANFTVQGGTGGVGGGGGGGGVNQSAETPAGGGNSLGGGGGGGGGPSNGTTAQGGTDVGNLGGGAGGAGASSYGSSSGGGGGGSGSALGGAIFVDSGLSFTVQALSGIPTVFNTSNNTTQAGTHGNGGGDGSDGTNGAALGNSIFLRANSALIFAANNANDLLTLGDQVAFVDDASFQSSSSQTNIFVKGNGTVIYNGSTQYQGNVIINNANFKVNGLIDQASINVCRDSSFSSQRGTLSGVGTLTGNIFANSGAISPNVGGTLTLGSLILNSVNTNALGSLVHININSSGTSLVAVTGSATLAGILEINLEANAKPGKYILLTSSGITGTFDSVTFTGQTPNYTLSYLPSGAPTYVELNFISSSVEIPATVNGSPILNPAVVCCGRPVILGPLPVPGPGPTHYAISKHTGNVICQLGQTKIQTYLKMHGKSGSCTITATKNNIVSKPLTVIAS